MTTRAAPGRMRVERPHAHWCTLPVSLHMPQSQRLERLVIDCPPEWRRDLELALLELQAAARVANISFAAAQAETGIAGLRLTLVRESAA